MSINNVSQTLRLREYYYMALRHKKIFLIVTVLSIFLATCFAFSLPKIYRAETVLLVEDEKILNPLISGLAITPSMSVRMRSLREELLSWQRLTLLVEKLKMDTDAKNPIQYERLIKDLRNKISIRIRGNHIVTVAYEGTDPKKAQEVVETLASIIVEGNITSANIEANSAIRFIEDQLDYYRKNLETSEQELREFREIYSSTLPIAVGMNEQLIQLKVELNNLLVENTEEHPRVIQVRKQIAQIEQQRDIFMTQAKNEGANIDPTEYAKLVTSVPLQEQQLAKLQRNYNVSSSIYQKLLERLETAKISQTLEDSDNGTKFRILEPARLPLEPVKPNKPLLILGGLIVGMGLGAVIVYLIELSNNSIKNVEEARSLLDLPIFGSISTIRPEELLLAERLRQEVRV